MADTIKISQLTAITTPATTDLLPCVQSGVTYNVAWNQLGSLAIELASLGIGVAASSTYGLYVSGTQTTDVTGQQAAIQVATTFTPAHTGTTTDAVNIVASFQAPVAGTSRASGLHVYNTLTSNVNNISDLFGIYVGPGSSNGGTATYSYGAYIYTPVATGSTATMALYADNGSFGYSLTSPAQNGIQVEGASYFGISAASADANTLYQFNGAAAYGTLFSGTQVATNSGLQEGIRLTITNSPGTGIGLTTGARSVSLHPSYICPSGQTFASTAGIYIYQTYSSNVGTITNAYGIYIDTGSGGAGTITTAYGLYVATPTAGSTNVCAYFSGAIQIGNATSSAGGSGTGTVKMNSSTNENNATWITMVVSGTTYYLPAWSTIA